MLGEVDRTVILREEDASAKLAKSPANCSFVELKCWLECLLVLILVS